MHQPTCLDALRARAWRLVCMARLVWVASVAAAKAGLRTWFRNWFRYQPLDPGHGPVAYRIYAFNEGGGEGFHVDLPVRSFEPSTWEADVRERTRWTAFRVEIRYLFRHKKYRMVLRPGDACVFPPYPEPAAPACRVPRGVLSARLQGPKGSSIDCDVTARVLKYQGPKGDFHTGLGLRGVRLHDMLPFDDHQDNLARFSHLRIIDTTARIVDLPYAENPRIRGTESTRG